MVEYAMHVSTIKTYLLASLLFLAGVLFVYLVTINIQPVQLPVSKVKPVTHGVNIPPQLVFFIKERQYDQYYIHNTDSQKTELVYQEVKSKNEKNFSLLLDNTVTISSSSEYKKFSLVNHKINTLSKGDIVVKINPEHSIVVNYPAKPYQEMLTFQFRNIATQATGSASMDNPKNIKPTIIGWSKDNQKILFTLSPTVRIENSNRLYLLNIREQTISRFDSDILTFGSAVPYIDTLTNSIYFMTSKGLKQQYLNNSFVTQTKVSTDSAKIMNDLVFSQDYNPHQIGYKTDKTIVLVNTQTGREDTIVSLSKEKMIADVIWKGNKVSYTYEETKNNRRYVYIIIYDISTKKSKTILEHSVELDESEKVIDLIGWLYSQNEGH